MSMLAFPTSPTAGSPPPLAAIVLPVFKHSVLINEAIGAALSQQTALPYRLVVVNDGCPFAETHETVLTHARAQPDRLVYLRRRNGGLSAARNTGIEFVLNAWPSVQAIYFLDADNRLFPHVLQRCWETLQADSAVGWAYPDMDMFGMEINARASGDYSILKHLQENYCEAGSMVKVELFRRGLRFDESMRLGFEDWDFWLQAIELGYVGRHVEAMGLRYRKRPESMLSNSERDRAEIVAYMRRKHKRLYARDTILRLEHREAPRYALLLGDRNEVVLATDPRLRETRLSWRDFVLRFMSAWADPQGVHCPNFLVYTTSEVVEAFEEMRLLNWSLWRLEGAIQAGKSLAIASLDPEAPAGALTIASEAAGDGQARGRRADIVMIARGLLQECVRDSSANWLASIAEATPLPPTFGLSIAADCEQARRARDSSAVSILLRAFYELRDLFHSNRTFVASEWRRLETIARSDLHHATRDLLQVGVAYPVVKRTPEERTLGVLLPLVSFGGVEKVAINLARSIRTAGWQPHLFVMASPTVENFAELAAVFESINFLDDPIAGRYDPSVSYSGIGFSSWVRDGDHRRALGLLMGMDAVVNCHSTDAHAIMGMLRRAGIATLAHLHLVDHDSLGEPTGIPYQVVAYEHSYQGILVISQKLYDWCRAMGIPEGKLLLAPNAPSYELPPQAVGAVMAARRLRRPGPLRVIYIGRLDRQKGIDRLEAMIKATSGPQSGIEWRVVGGSVLNDGAARQVPQAIEPFRRPPARTPEELTEHLAWADVIAMPSYFEGVPLMLLEAMRLGVVPIATRVGAVHEIVEDGGVGFLVENGPLHAVVAQFLRHLRALQADRARLAALSEAAAAASTARDWTATAAAVARYLDALATAGAASAGPADGRGADGETARPAHAAGS